MSFIEETVDISRWILQMLGTAAFVYVQLLTINPFIIGAVLMIFLYIIAKVEAGAFNPALAVGRYLSGQMTAQVALLYLSAQVVGGIIAGLAYYAVAD